MNIFKFVFRSRGAANFARRTLQIATRFGGSPARMGARFDRFMDVLDESGIRPTFPITALPMSRNPRFAHRLLERGAELAVHAWSHIDLTTLDYEGQTRHLGDAIQLFRDHGIPFTGFRAPYLHWNEDTMRVVEAYKFRYSSNQTIWWDVVDLARLDEAARDGFEKGRAFYQPVDAADVVALPYRRRGFVEIPVSLPDDEIMLDRMYMHDAAFLRRAWMDILEASYRRGDIFTLQLHPERIDFFADALRDVLTEARRKKPGVWIATLDQVAGWWGDKARNRATFVRENGRFRVDVEACAGTTVYVREDGRERTIDPGTFAVETPVRPCVGVSPVAGREIVQKLTDMGYIVEAGDNTDDFAVHVGNPEGDDLAVLEKCVQTIESCRGALVRFGAWPYGNRSAMSVTGDIDALTVWDFIHRFRGA